MHVRTLVWVCMGTPCEIRTHVYAVKERRPRPLDEGGYMGLKIGVFVAGVGIEPTYMGYEPTR